VIPLIPAVCPNINRSRYQFRRVGRIRGNCFSRISRTPDIASTQSRSHSFHFQTGSLRISDYARVSNQHRNSNRRKKTVPRTVSRLRDASVHPNTFVRVNGNSRKGNLLISRIKLELDATRVSTESARALPTRRTGRSSGILASRSACS